jgi:hypothetical protein
MGELSEREDQWQRRATGAAIERKPRRPQNSCAPSRSDNCPINSGAGSWLASCSAGSRCDISRRSRKG